MPSLLCWFSAARTVSLWDSEWQSLWPVSISWILWMRAVRSALVLSSVQAAPVLRPSFGIHLRNAPGHYCRGNFAPPIFFPSILLLLSISLILSFPHPLFPISASASECVCVWVCPSVSVDWPMSPGLCPLGVCTSPSECVSGCVCICVGLFPLCDPLPNSPFPSLALYHLCGISTVSERDHYHAQIQHRIHWACMTHQRPWKLPCLPTGLNTPLINKTKVSNTG